MTIKRKAISSAIYGAAAIFAVYLAPFPLFAVIGILLGVVGVVRAIRTWLEFRRMPVRTVAKRYGITAGVCILAIPIVVSLAIWYVDGFHVDNPAGFSSPSVVADYTDVKPPPTARNIRTAEWHQGMGFDEFVRFEAPTNVCIAYAKQVAKGRPLVHFDSPPLDPSKLGSKYIPNLNWFDISKANNIVGTQEDPLVYVDKSRGVFYFYEGF